MILFEIGHKVNTYIKKRKKQAAGRYLSPVRKIEHTAPIKDRRLVAMTFDDGPCGKSPNPGSDKKSLTEALLDALKAYGAHGTFDVVGDTSSNYPDGIGQAGTASWGGISYDHYPDFELDSYGGVFNQPDLARMILSGGHELANHGYRHIIYGPIKMIYGKRHHFNSLLEVVDDLNALHNLVQKELGYQMKLARPPHYIDNIPDGYTAYDAYRCMGYNYLAASMDGGGWKPGSGNYKKDVDDMVSPFRKMLSENPDSLNGKIIFQKDGCNMTKETPIADALPLQLKLLKEFGYEVVSVSELTGLSPFEDISRDNPCFEAARKLINRGYCIGYKNNTFQPERTITRGELAMMLTPPKIFQNSIDCSTGTAEIRGYRKNDKYIDVPETHPYYQGIAYCSEMGYFKDISVTRFEPDKHLEVMEFEEVMDILFEGRSIRNTPAWNTSLLTRAEVIPVLEQALHV